MAWQIHSQAYTQENWRYVDTKACIKMSTTALFTTAKKWKQFTCPAAYEWINKFPYNGILFRYKQEQSSDSSYNTDEPWNYDKRSQSLRPHIVWFHVYEMSTTGKPTETESKLVVAGGRGRQGSGMTTNRHWVSCGVIKIFWKQQL